MKPRWLRDEMPMVAAWIDQLREAFGNDEINEVIRAGMNGEPVFYATENGREIGTRPEQGDAWNAKDVGARFTGDEHRDPERRSEK